MNQSTDSIPEVVTVEWQILSDGVPGHPEYRKPGQLQNYGRFKDRGMAVSLFRAFRDEAPDAETRLYERTTTIALVQIEVEP